MLPAGQLPFLIWAGADCLPTPLNFWHGHFSKCLLCDSPNRTSTYILMLGSSRTRSTHMEIWLNSKLPISHVHEEMLTIAWQFGNNVFLFDFIQARSMIPVEEGIISFALGDQVQGLVRRLTWLISISTGNKFSLLTLRILLWSLCVCVCVCACMRACMYVCGTTVLPTANLYADIPLWRAPDSLTATIHINISTTPARSDIMLFGDSSIHSLELMVSTNQKGPSGCQRNEN